jgi:hypothetical protein
VTYLQIRGHQGSSEPLLADQGNLKGVLQWYSLLYVVYPSCHKYCVRAVFSAGAFQKGLCSHYLHLSSHCVVPITARYCKLKEIDHMFTCFPSWLLQDRVIDISNCKY